VSGSLIKVCLELLITSLIFLFCHLIIFCLNLYSLNIIHTDIKPENILFANGK
jgi:serine/threonine protein kinase